MKKNILFILSCVFIIGFTTTCGSKQKSDKQSDAENVETIKAEPATSKYVKLAEKMNANMPQFFPLGIRMDKVEAVSKNEFRYIYTFTQEPKVPSEEFIRGMKPALILGLQQEKEMDDFRKDKMTLLYTYKMMDGKIYAEIRLEPSEYSK